MRLITFTRPDGATFIPLFTDEGKAARSAQGAMRVVALTGRELLAGTPGATIVINPNDEHCVLYPEEIVGLLATGFVARVESETMQEPRWIDIEPDVPAWLVTLLQEFFVNLLYVEAVRLASMGPSDNPAHQVLTLIITCPTMHGERAARATITAVQPACSAHDLPWILRSRHRTSPIAALRAWVEQSTSVLRHLRRSLREHLPSGSHHAKLCRDKWLHRCDRVRSCTRMVAAAAGGNRRHAAAGEGSQEGGRVAPVHRRPTARCVGSTAAFVEWSE